MTDFCDLSIKEQLRLEKKGSEWEQVKPPIKMVEIPLNELQELREQLDNQWVSVEGAKQLPVGEWLVYLEEPLIGSNIHAAVVNENMTIIGSLFAFDAPKVIAYMKQPIKPRGQHEPN